MYKSFTFDLHFCTLLQNCSMKRVALIICTVGTLLACQNTESTEELDALRAANRALSDELSRKDSTLNIFQDAFSEIQKNLSLISEREVAIQLRAGDLKVGEDVRTEITKDIQAINLLLKQNKDAISKLNKSLSKMGMENTAFKKLIDQLSADIRTKEEEVAYLKENLTAANFTIEILNEMLDSAEFRSEMQAVMLRLQEGELNKAYVAIGTYKELQRNGVLRKEGSIIGIAGSKKLRPDFNRDYFEKIDINNLKSIPLNAKKVEVVTPHPSSSYTIDGTDKKTLAINNPAIFWEASKYLVVVVD